MKFTCASLFIISVSAAATKQQQQDQASCPPPNFSAVSNFVTESYLGKWFVQEMTETRYLKLKQFFCVSAEYGVKENGDISVDNRSRLESIKGKSKGIVLSAVVKDKAEPGKLGPSWRVIRLPNFLKGPYWVVATSAVNSTSGMYDWAIVTGGPPKSLNPANGLCNAVNKSWILFNGNNEGFWLFTRVQEASVETLKVMKDTAVGLGLDITQLVKVQQKGCEALPSRL